MESYITQIYFKIPDMDKDTREFFDFKRVSVLDELSRPSFFNGLGWKPPYIDRLAPKAYIDRSFRPLQDAFTLKFYWSSLIGQDVPMAIYQSPCSEWFLSPYMRFIDDIRFDTKSLQIGNHWYDWGFQISTKNEHDDFELLSKLYRNNVSVPHSKKDFGNAYRYFLAARNYDREYIKSSGLDVLRNELRIRDKLIAPYHTCNTSIPINTFIDINDCYAGTFSRRSFLSSRTK